MSQIRLSYEDDFLVITLNRPEMRNAFNAQMIMELKDIFSKIETGGYEVLERKIRGVFLRGEGRAFCAGGDLSWMQSMVDYTFEENLKDAEAMYSMFEQIYNCPLPVVTFVHGACFGGGIGLLAVSDYVFSEETTQFSFSEVTIGLVPAVISCFLLQKIPSGLLTPYMMTGKIFSANRALSWGLVHETFNSEDRGDKWESVKDLLDNAGPEAVRATKDMIHSQSPLLRPTWEEISKKAIQVLAERRVSDEGQSGLKRFLERRSKQG